MPKPADIALRWDERGGSYALYSQGRAIAAQVTDETPAWRAGLNTWRSFAFEGRAGRLSLLSEARGGRAGYWYAYRRQGRRTLKRYAGRAAALRIAALEALAAELAAPREPEIVAPAEPLSQILAPKLLPPRLRGPLIARPDLIAGLEQARAGRLTLVSAPAGYGKTSLLTGWLRQLELRIENEELPNGLPEEAHSQFSILNSPPQAAWLTLDAGDNDPLRFWRYVVSACRDLQIDQGRAAAAQLATPPPVEQGRSPLDLALAALINAISAAGRPGLLVLDDYHLIEEPQIHAGLAFLIAHLPPNLHLVISSRGRIDLALARLRAQGGLYEIGPAQLRLSRDESARLLRLLGAPALSGAMIDRIDRQIAGWPAGLRLLALALQGRSDAQAIAAVLDGFAGSHRLLLDYVISEVLDVQPGPVQRFLLHTSGLGRLCAPLCDSLTGEDDGAARLADLDRAGLFLEPLDDTGAWYRYHTLFAEAVQAVARRRLGPERVRMLAARASAWYAGHDLPTEAVEAALQAEDAELAAARIEQALGPAGAGFAAIHAGKIYEFHTLRRWIERLPPAERRRPQIALSYATSLLFVFLIEQTPATAQAAAEIGAALEDAEAGFAAAGHGPGLGQVYAFRALMARQHGDIGSASSWAERSLGLLPADELAARSISQGTLGIAALLAGRLGAAGQAFRAARALCEQIGNRWWTRANVALLSSVQLAQGELRAAEAHFRLLLGEARAENDSDDIAHMQVCLAQIAYERDDLDGAAAAADEALGLAGQLANDEVYTLAAVTLARARHAQGAPAAAIKLLHDALARLDPDSSPLRGRLARELRAALATLQLADGDLAAARRWGQARSRPDPAATQALSDREGLLLARIALAEGRPAAALGLLGPLLDAARSDGRATVALEARLLTGLALRDAGQSAAAGSVIAAALAEAAGEGYRRIFLDLGSPAAELIRIAMPDLAPRPAQRYAQALLGALGGGQREPLSPRERQVLGLLAAGHSNAEIADELIVSIHTVRSQVRSIYRKLGIHSRAAAGARARELGII